MSTASEYRILLVTAYWRTNLTMRQLAPVFGISKSSADRIIDHLGPMLALQRRKRFGKNTVLIVDGTLVPTRDHTVAEQSKNYRYSTAHQATGPVIPHRRRQGEELPSWKEERNRFTSRFVPEWSTSSPV